MEDARLTLVDSFDKLCEFHQWLGERRACLAFDTETGGLHPWEHDLRLLQVGDARAGWAFPWHGWGGAPLQALRDYDGPLVAHNAIFDVQFLEQHAPVKMRWDWSNTHDTMLMAYLVDPTRSAALKNLAVRYVDKNAGVGQTLLAQAMAKQHWGWDDVPLDFPLYWAYASLDTVLTARLWETLTPLIAPYQDVYDLEMQVARLVALMQRRGAPIDLDYAARKANELRQFIDEGTSWCEAMHGVRPSQNGAVADALISAGCELTARTPTGKFKLDEDVLTELDHPLASTVLAIRKSQKLLSTYFEHFLADHDHGVLHCNIRQIGAAKTGRMSVADPPLQTLPRTRDVRDCFVGTGANRLVLADFDQVEMRLLAHFCKDEGLIDAILSGDLHTETARKVYADPDLQKKDPRRQLAKNAGFAKIYGAGVQKFAITAGVGVAEAQRFLASYDVMFPGVKRFCQQVIALGTSRLASEGEASVTTPLGRRNVADQEGAYKLVNYLIQGTAADVLKQAMVRLDNAGLSDVMVLPIHDELLFDVPPEDVDDVTRIIQEQMGTNDYVVPLTVGVDVVDRWGDKYASV